MEFIGGRPGPLPEFDAPEGLVRGADREGPIFPRTPWPSVGAAYFATLGIAAALRARQVSGLGQRVTTSLLQGALAAVCLNWQRVENPDAPLYWMWPVDSRSIEGLYECADGKWVHHWTLRPRWVLSAAEGGKLSPREFDNGYRDDPDRVSMEPDGMLTGIFLHPRWRTRSRSSRPMSGSVQQKRQAWVSPPSDPRARRWLTSPSLPMAVWSRSTTLTRDRSITPDRCWNSPVTRFCRRTGTSLRAAHRGGLGRNRLEHAICRCHGRGPSATRPSLGGNSRPRPRARRRWAIYRACPC